MTKEEYIENVRDLIQNVILRNKDVEITELVNAAKELVKVQRFCCTTDKDQELTDEVVSQAVVNSKELRKVTVNIFALFSK